MNDKTILVLGAALALLAGCGAKSGGGEESATVGGDLTGARIGGPFTLTDQDGQKRSWSDFQGKYRLVYFGYSFCPDVCPIDLQRIAQGFRLFEQKAPERAAKVQPIFITLDPERDTPAVVKTYVSAFHPRLIGLTGTPKEIAAVAKEFVVVYSREKPEGSTDYLVSHSRTPYLFDPDGKPLALVPVDDPSTPDKDEGSAEEVEKALEHWVR
ncbi:MAG: SCO family protein [Sphingobium sp.]